jgi:hypothetical protein
MNSRSSQTLPAKKSQVRPEIIAPQLPPGRRHLSLGRMPRMELPQTVGVIPDCVSRRSALLEESQKTLLQRIIHAWVFRWNIAHKQESIGNHGLAASWCFFGSVGNHGIHGIHGKKTFIFRILIESRSRRMIQCYPDASGVFRRTLNLNLNPNLHTVCGTSSPQAGGLAAVRSLQ